MSTFCRLLSKINNISFHMSTRKIARAFFSQTFFVDMAKYKNKIYFTVERLIEKKEKCFSTKCRPQDFFFRIINSNFVLCQRRRVLSHVILDIVKISNNVTDCREREIKKRKTKKKLFA